MTLQSMLRSRSPLRDFRALGSSLSFHAVLVLVASVASLRVALPPDQPSPLVLQTETGPVDNRAPAEAGGGAPGSLSGNTLPDALRLSADGTTPDGKAPRDPVADTLLANVLPAPLSPDDTQRAMPAVTSTGIGVSPATVMGGGGGSGGGSGGGVGKGLGPATEFFGVREHGNSFAFVIDRSDSMSSRGALSVAKRELLASIDQLPPDARFAVIFYNMKPEVMLDAAGEPRLMTATAENKERARARIATFRPEGGTDHMRALRAGLGLRPEVIYFLTDAQLMTNDDAAQIKAEAGPIRIQAVEFGSGPPLGTPDPLQKMAVSTGGSFRYVDVASFHKPDG